MTSPDIDLLLRRWSQEFDARLGGCFYSFAGAPPLLVEAMRYALLTPGKRLRPFLVQEGCLLCGTAADRAFGAAAAMECVHAFSLVHDDLPAMDNDLVRRGQPSCHAKYGEAVAILTGDALLSIAFELLTRHYEDGSIVRMMVQALSQAAGAQGMIGGQVEDLLSERLPPDWSTVERIHRMKTARLMACACELGALAGGGAADVREKLSQFGWHLGIAFQIADDLLDATASSHSLGGVDSPGKQTAPRCVGKEEAYRRAADEIRRAEQALEGFGPQANTLRALAEFVVERTR